MNKKIAIANLLLLLTFFILSFGHGISCCLTFGYGLGDVFYLTPIWIVTLIYFILIVGFKKRIFINYETIVIFGVIALVLILNLLFNRGPECPC